jgi:hypothetical protein
MLAGLILTSVGAVCLVIALAARWGLRWRARQVANWPVALARVTSVDILESGSALARHMPWVTYAYEVDGRMFEGDRLRLGGRIMFAHRARAVEYLKRFPVNGVVNARYHPRRPSLALLDETPQDTLFHVFLIFACLWAPMGLLLLALPPG